MIGIKVNGGWLELPDNFKIVLTRKSPLYFGGDMNSIEGNYTIPVNIDATDVNRQLLKFPEFLNNWDGFVEHFGTLFLGGNYYEGVKVHATEADKKKYRIQLFSGAGVLSDLKKRTIRNYPLAAEYMPAPGINNVSQAYANYALSTQTTENHSYIVVPTYVRDKDENPQEVELLYPKVHILLKKIFALSYHFSTEMDNYEELQKLLLHSTVQNNMLVVSYLQVLPKLPVLTLIKSINKFFCMGIDVDTRSNTIRHFVIKDILNKIEFVDYSSRRVSNFQKKTTSYSVKGFDYYRDDLNDLEKDDFHSLVQIDPVQTIDDLPENSDYLDICFVYETHKWYSFNGDEWEVTEGEPGEEEDVGFQDLNALKIEKEGSDIKSDIGAMYMENFGKLLPSTSLPSKSIPLDPKEVENGLFVFFRGLIDGEPHSSHNEFDANGNDIANYSLKWHGENGLFEKWWKPWIDFLNSTVPVEVDMIWEEKDLHEFDFLKALELWDEHSGGYHRFFIQEQKISVSMKGMEKARQKLIQIREIP